MSDSDSNAEIDYMRGMSLSLCQERRSVTLTPPGFSDDTVKGLNMMWEDDGNTPNNDKCSYILDRKTLTVYKAYPGIIMAPVTFVMGAPDVDFIGMMRESKTWERYFGKMNITPKDRLRFISDCVMSLPPQQAVAKDHILNVMPDIDIDCDADEEFEFEFNLADNISAMVHRTNTIGAVNS